MPDGDGRVVRVALVAAVLFGLDALASQAPARPDLRGCRRRPRHYARRGPPDAGLLTEKDFGRAMPPALARAAPPARFGAGCIAVPSRPESYGPGGTGVISVLPYAASTCVVFLPRTSRGLARPTGPVLRSRMSRVMS